MSRMSKKEKEEMVFFLDENGRIKHNDLCRKCERDCKQSYRAEVFCPYFKSKRAVT